MKPSYPNYLKLAEKHPDHSVAQLADKMGVGHLQAIAWDARSKGSK